MLPPLHGGAPVGRTGYAGYTGRGGDSRLSDYVPSRASSRATSVYSSLDREVWSINRTPAPPSEASFAFGSDDGGSSRGSSRGASRLRGLPTPSDDRPPAPPTPPWPQWKQRAHQPMPPPTLHRTNVGPAPFRQRFAEAARARRLDERREEWLKRRHLAEQQRQIDELELQLRIQEKERLLACEERMRKEETIRQVLDVNPEKHKKLRKTKPLLQLLADRHLAAGHEKDFKSLASAINGKGSNSRRIFGRRKRTTSGLRQHRVRRNPSAQ